jgi:hypothetical protein
VPELDHSVVSSFTVLESFLLLLCSDFACMPKTISLSLVPSLFHQYFLDVIATQRTYLPDESRRICH